LLLFSYFFHFRVGKKESLLKSEKSLIDANKTLENERSFSQAYQNH